MPFRVRWTEPSGAKFGDAATAKAAFEKYLEMQGKGYAGVEVRDDAGKKLTTDELQRLILLDTRKRLDASRP